MKPPKYSSLPARFWDKVTVVHSGCWEWNASRNPAGYGKYQTGTHRKSASRYAHRLAHADSHCDDAVIVRHTCDNPPCVNPRHLLCGSSQDNANDMVTRGRVAVGEQSSGSKLTTADVLSIIRQAGTIPQRTLAEQYGVHRVTISLIVNKKTWKHLH